MQGRLNGKALAQAFDRARSHCDGQQRNAHLPAARAEVTRDPRRVDFTNLEPMRMYTVRVRSGDQALFTAQFQTLSRKPWFNWRYVAVGALLLVLVAVAGRAWKTRRKSGW